MMCSCADAARQSEFLRSGAGDQRTGLGSCRRYTAPPRPNGWKKAGATAILIGANSMHKVHDKVAAAVSVPVIHIADAVGQKMKADGIDSAALIGTRNVMAENWYRQRLGEAWRDIASVGGRRCRLSWTGLFTKS